MFQVPRTRKTARYGWIPDLPDSRDKPFNYYDALRAVAPVYGKTQLPPSIDLRSNMPPIYDQGELGSCTGNACAAAMAYARNMQGLPEINPSRLMLYYNARVIEGTTASDSGAQIRDIIKAAAAWGVCDEVLWPYETIRVMTVPGPDAYAAALKDKAISYTRLITTVTQLNACLAAGDPVMIGISVYDSFESDAVAASGVVPMPGPNEGLVGGHAVVLVGYDDVTRTYMARNSWGTSWGQAGYFSLPYGYVTDPDLASDAWSLKLVTP